MCISGDGGGGGGGGGGGVEVPNSVLTRPHVWVLCTIMSNNFFQLQFEGRYLFHYAKMMDKINGT